MNNKQKLELLMRAVSASNEDALLDELKAAAFEVLLFNHSSECSDWQKILVEQYGDEVIDAFGTDIRRPHRLM